MEPARIIVTAVVLNPFISSPCPGFFVLRWGPTPSALRPSAAPGGYRTVQDSNRRVRMVVVVTAAQRHRRPTLTHSMWWREPGRMRNGWQLLAAEGGHKREHADS